MARLEVPEPSRHAVGPPTAPDPLGQGIIHPVMCKVGVHVRIALDAPLERGYDVVAGVGVCQVGAVPKADTVGPFLRLRAVVVGKGKAPRRVTVAAGQREPSWLRLAQVEMDLGALVDVATLDGLILRLGQGG